MCLLLFCYLSVFVGLTAGSYNTANKTDFEKCKVYYSRYGSVYRDFFEIHEVPWNDTLIDFHFSVLAPSDAHILLAPSKDVGKDDPVYEIVIGAGGNTFSDIRRARKANVRASQSTTNILSSLDIKSFWLHVSREGLIEVGKDGEDLAFISWQDSDLLPINYISFSTWTGVEAKWFFDCPNESNTTTKEAGKVLTHRERLRKDFIDTYNPFSHSGLNVSNFINLEMNFLPTFISLNEYKSTMDVKALITLTWQDEKLVWNASEYGNISTLHVTQREIWRPNLIVFNNVNEEGDILSNTLMVVKSNGVVNWSPNAHFKVWCAAKNMGTWPSDSHDCNLLFGFPDHLDRLRLNFSSSSSSILQIQYKSEWKILLVEVDTDSGRENETTGEIYDLPSLNLKFKLKRYSDIYGVIFFSPFVVIGVMLLATFLVSPFGSTRILIGAFELILTGVVIVGLGYFMPVHPERVPFLVLLYSYTLISVSISIVLSVIVINLSRGRHKTNLPYLLCRILDSNIMKFLLCLPRDTVASEEYGALEVMTNSKTGGQHLWILLGVVIDRLSFLVYLILFVAILCVKRSYLN